LEKEFRIYQQHQQRFLEIASIEYIIVPIAPPDSTAIKKETSRRCNVPRERGVESE